MLGTQYRIPARTTDTVVRLPRGARHPARSPGAKRNCSRAARRARPRSNGHGRRWTYCGRRRCVEQAKGDCRARPRLRPWSSAERSAWLEKRKQGKRHAMFDRSRCQELLWLPGYRRYSYRLFITDMRTRRQKTCSTAVPASFPLWIAILPGTMLPWKSLPAQTRT